VNKNKLLSKNYPVNLSKKQQAVIALIITNIIWGAAAPIFKWSLQNIHPFTLAFLRFAIASAILFPFAIREVNIERKDIPQIFLLSFFGITVNISFFFLALTRTASINAPIIGSAAPLFIILASVFFLKEKLKMRVLFGACMGFIGIFLIVARPIIESGFDSSVVGNLFLIVATIGSIIHVILTKEIDRKHKPIALAFCSFVIGAFTFLPMLTQEVAVYGFLKNLTMAGIVGIIFGGVFSSALAYFLFYWSMQNISASEAGLFTYLDPIIAVLIAVPLLGEIPTTTYIVGSLLIFGGIYTAEGRVHYHPLHLLKKID